MITITCFFALIAIIFSATLTIKPLSVATIAGAEKEPDALNLPAPELVGGPWFNTPGC